MLIFPLKKSWYEKIKSGEKAIEYREVKPYWTRRFYNENGGESSAMVEENVFAEPLLVGQAVVFLTMECKLRLGYTNKYMTANITKIEVVEGKDTDLHIDKPVYAIHLADVKEIEG
ncbi:MAG: hypothetical protein J6J71_02050 [Prevotella sp.]|nr:hypothetical protein [Prevotella sp.]